MADTTGIEWTDATWNVVTGCDKVSPGCDRCYAETFAERWRGIPGHHFENGFDITLRPERLDLPFRWKKPKRVFVNSMSDLFHKDIPDEYIAQVFAVMARTPQHTYQILTKRHGRMRSLVGSLIDGGQSLIEAAPDEETALALYDTVWPLPNVWLGVSVEDQKRADLRIPALVDTAAAVRFLSCEPLLGPVDLTRWLRPVPGCGHVDSDDGTCGHPDAFTPECHRWADCPVRNRLTDWHGPDWVIVGGESGRGARPMRPEWAAEIVHQCQISGVAMFVKQLGSCWGKQHKDIDQFPGDLQVREFPDAFYAESAA
ncbi:DUF5131 family protein [Streptomyces asiaticus]|uniref:DUF5131 family protein n=1 Tax=Streptomyces asiaticus TaxID=114695 RepID=UPI001BA67470|nr:phage Gp37/Gp68 family protein [Streptomyces asiaticus]